MDGFPTVVIVWANPRRPDLIHCSFLVSGASADDALAEVKRRVTACFRPTKNSDRSRLPLLALGLRISGQAIWKLGDVGGNPSRLVHCEHVRSVGISTVFATIDVSEALAGCVPHFIAAGNLLYSPWRRKAAGPLFRPAPRSQKKRPQGCSSHTLGVASTETYKNFWLAALDAA